MKNSLSKLMLLTLALVGGTALAKRANAQLLKEELPPQAQSIDVENRVGEFVPLDLIFNDERGNAVGLGKFFKQGKPIVLTLNYSDCPGLCVAQLDMLVATLRDLSGVELGEDFEILTVSIDPTELPEKAARSKAKYTGLLSGEGAQKGWHFLTGRQSDIAGLADAVGFRYSYDRVNKRYNHAAATYFLSADGRICRYLLSLGAEPQQFQLAVAEAAEGKLTRTFADTIIQMCYMYDPDANRYTASARRMLAFAGGAFVLLLVGFTAPFWFSGRPRTDQATAAKAPASGNATRQPQVVSYNNGLAQSSARDADGQQTPTDSSNRPPADVSSDTTEAVK